MEISNKDIWRDSKKYCIICENECIGYGIQIINNFICNKCIERMNLIDVGSDEYEIIKNKIKNSIADKIIKNQGDMEKTCKEILGEYELWEF